MLHILPHIRVGLKPNKEIGKEIFEKTDISRLA
jgi:hypothetical protein